MSTGIVIRLVKPSENDSVHALVQTIADETFAYLFGTTPCSVEWSSPTLGLSSSTSIAAGEFNVNFRMRSSATRCSR